MRLEHTLLCSLRYINWHLVVVVDVDVVVIVVVAAFAAVVIGCIFNTSFFINDYFGIQSMVGYLFIFVNGSVLKSSCAELSAYEIEKFTLQLTRKKTKCLPAASFKYFVMFKVSYIDCHRNAKSKSVWK